MTHKNNERLTLTIEEAAEALGIGRNLAYAQAAKGNLPAIRFGRRLLVPRLALERLLAEAAQDRESVAGSA